MSKLFKRQIGRLLLGICERFPTVKPLVKRWGLRTSQEWFHENPVSVQIPGGRSLKLAGLTENYLTFELFWRGLEYYEPITMLVTRELASRGGTFLDVGANIGTYTLVLAACEPKLKVTAFEPNPKAYGLLRANVRLNGLSSVTCEQAAVSDHEGVAVLYLCASDMSASLEPDFETTTARDTVTLTSLDSYLALHDLPGPLLLKVDVEGHESVFFRGALQVLEKRAPDIICEITGPLDPDVSASLRERGYRFYQITDQGLLEASELNLNVRGSFLFLNYLLSTAPEPVIHGIFRAIEPKVRKINLKNTSKYVAPEMIRRLRARSDGREDLPRRSAMLQRTTGSGI